MIPHVMCRHCGHVFSSDAEGDEQVKCPACGRTDTPSGLMRPTGFPSLEVFTRNWQRVREVEGSSGTEDAEPDTSE